LVSQDGSAAICQRIESDKRAGDAGCLHILADRPFDWTHESHLTPKPPKKTRDFGPLAAKFSANADDRRRELAGMLGVSNESLDALGVGYSVPDRAWTFSERDASGKVIGLNRRFRPDPKTGKSKKQQFAGHKRGLTYVTIEGDGPIYVCEGGSDVAALSTMGIPNAVGRPGNNQGGELLAELLAGTDYPIVILGENDQKPDGQWPGKDGAVLIATRLAEALGRPITWALPSRQANDVLEWLQDHGGDGQAFVDELETTIIEPPKVEPAYVPPVDNAELSTLEFWRDDLAMSRKRIATRPGRYVDESPAGAGKSYSDGIALQQVERSLIGVPTHENARELVAELKKQGVHAVAFPERTAANCQRVDECKSAEGMTLNARASVCSACPLLKNCQFLQDIDKARDADHLVSTHARIARIGLAEMSAGRQYVSIHENTMGVLRPSVIVTDRQLASLEGFLAELLDNPSRPGEPDRPGFLSTSNDVQHAFVGKMLEVVEWLRDRVRSVGATAKLELPEGVDKPRGIDRALFTNGQGRLRGQALRVVLDVATGKADELFAIVGKRRGKAGQEVEHRSLMATWHHKPNPRAATIFSDATADERLREILPGLVDVTPKGRLERFHQVSQIKFDITRKTSPEVVKSWIRGTLVANPEAVNVGVMVHRTHIKAVDELEPHFRQRIRRLTYFGSGEDRSSNEWHRTCDLLVIAGTARPGESAVQGHLAQTGQAEKATIDQSEWIDFKWQARTQSGEPETVGSKRYANEAWQASHRALTRAAMIQAVGRGRGYQRDGIRVVVISSEEIGERLSDSPFQPLNATQGAVLAVMENLSAGTPYNSIKGISARKIGEGLDVSLRSVQTTLKELERRGTVQRRGINRSTVWALVHHAEAEAETICRETDEPPKIQGETTETGESGRIEEKRASDRPVNDLERGDAMETSSDFGGKPPD